MKKIKFFILILILVIVVTGILIITNYINKGLILKVETKENGHTAACVKIYNNGNVRTSLNIGKNRKLSESETNQLIELIDKVDKDKYFYKSTAMVVTSGKIVKIYNSKNEEIVIKDFYLTNYTEEANKIFEFLKNNDLY